MDKVFCIYGFLRDFNGHDIDLSGIPKVVYIPSKRYEDKDEMITKERLIELIDDKIVMAIYEYDTKYFNDEFKQLSVPQFNQAFQQPQRLLSFVNHIRKSIDLMESTYGNDISDDTTIFLLRSDICLTSIDFDNTEKLLVNFDIIVEKFEVSGRGVRDMFFVCKKRNIEIFKSLYDSYKQYLVDYYDENKQGEKIHGVRPEDVFLHHFNMNNARITAHPSLKFKWRHICNEFCGHHKNNAKILGDDSS